MNYQKQPYEVAMEAAEWLLGNDDNGMSESDRIRFFSWLTESPRHLREYIRAARLARSLKGALSIRPESGSGQRMSRAELRALAKRLGGLDKQAPGGTEEGQHKNRA